MITQFHDRKEAGLLLAERLEVYIKNTSLASLAQKKQKKNLLLLWPFLAVVLF